MDLCPRCRKPVVVVASRAPSCPACGLGRRPDAADETPAARRVRVDAVVVLGLVLVVFGAGRIALANTPWYSLFSLGLGLVDALLAAGVGLGLIGARFLSPSEADGRGAGASGMGAMAIAAWLCVCLALAATIWLGPFGFPLVYYLCALGGLMGLGVTIAEVARFATARNEPGAGRGAGRNVALGTFAVVAAGALAVWMHYMLSNFEWT